MLWVRRLFRDPISGLTHLVGALLSAFGLFYLVGISAPLGPRGIASVAVYGVSMVMLYASSSTYHLLHVRTATRARLRQLDHAMVPVFIAGTYTPFCVIALPGILGHGVLIAIWTMAFGGLLKSIFWIHSPRWVTAGVFVVMGWLIVVAAYPLALAVGPDIVAYILAGGCAYTLGAAVYARKWPDPWPATFGFHEIWHLFVLVGSALHYVAVLTMLLAAA